MENGVTWCVMSIMRASGATPSITALQIATASLAVPKSVIKTMVARCAEGYAGEESMALEPLSAGGFVQPAAQKAPVNAHAAANDCAARRIFVRRNSASINSP